MSHSGLNLPGMQHQQMHPHALAHQQQQHQQQHAPHQQLPHQQLSHTHHAHHHQPHQPHHHQPQPKLPTVQPPLTPGQWEVAELVKQFTDVVHQKFAVLYDELREVKRLQYDNKELLFSTLKIKYPELKDKIEAKERRESLERTAALGGEDRPLSYDPNISPDSSDSTPTPAKRRKYAKEIQSKIQSICRPLWRAKTTLTGQEQTQLAAQLAQDIGVEPVEASEIVQSFWNTNRGNAKRKYTELDNFRLGLQKMLAMDPVRKARVMEFYGFEAEDDIRKDLEEVTGILEEERSRGFGRVTPGKGKKRKTPISPSELMTEAHKKRPATVKGRARAFGTQMYHMFVEPEEPIVPDLSGMNQQIGIVGESSQSSPLQMHHHQHELHRHEHHDMQQREHHHHPGVGIPTVPGVPPGATHAQMMPPSQ